MKSDSATNDASAPLMTHSPAIAGARCAARRLKRAHVLMGAQRAGGAWGGGRGARGAAAPLSPSHTALSESLTTSKELVS